MSEKERGNLYLKFAKVVELYQEAGLGYPPSGVKMQSFSNPAESHPLSSWPVFSNNFHMYTFAVAVVEGEPVFEGDELYWTESRNPVSWEFGPYSPYNLGQLIALIKAGHATWKKPATKDETEIGFLKGKVRELEERIHKLTKGSDCER